MNDRSPGAAWPALPLDAWRDTYETLHMWTQVVGKVRLALAPQANHWWQTPLYVTARGLTTSPIPYEDRACEILFDFIDHELVLETSDGGMQRIALVPRSVADFYHATMAALHALGIDVHIRTLPSEVPNPVRFEVDHAHASYDPVWANTCWRVLLATDHVFKEHQSRWLGKSSPVHFFWGSFDLAVSRFSGRRAPVRAGADSITREAYSHELLSWGFWPGRVGLCEATYYGYAVPEPAGFRDAKVQPPEARYRTDLGEYLLSYEDVRTSASPEHTLLSFLESTYEAGAELGGWNRAELERKAA